MYIQGSKHRGYSRCLFVARFCSYRKRSKMKTAHVHGANNNRKVSNMIIAESSIPERGYSRKNSSGWSRLWNMMQTGLVSEKVAVMGAKLRRLGWRHTQELGRTGASKSSQSSSKTSQESLKQQNGRIQFKMYKGPSGICAENRR